MSYITVTDAKGTIHHLNPAHIVMLRRNHVGAVVFTSIPTLTVEVDAEGLADLLLVGVVPS